MRSRIICGDCLRHLKKLPDEFVHCCVTSPPYFRQRDYGVDGQIGLEKTVGEYVEKLVSVFREVRRVLRNDGTLWLNLGDTYSASGCGRSPGQKVSSLKRPKKNSLGLGQKQMLMIPFRIALALQADGWIVRDDIIWRKNNAMPSSVRDRCVKAHEYVFLLAKNVKYYYDYAAMQEPATCAGKPRGGSKNRYEQNTAGMDSKIYNTKNRRSVWTIGVDTTPGKKHHATFPEKLAEICILAGCPEGGTVLDPFLGSGTTAIVAKKNGRNCIGIELNPEYTLHAGERVQNTQKEKP